MSFGNWGRQCGGIVVVAVGCKAAPSTDTGSSSAVTPAQVASVASTASSLLVAADPPRERAATTATVGVVLADGSKAGDPPRRKVDASCAKHSFCDVLALFARAARQDAEAKATLASDVLEHGCAFTAGDVSANLCGSVGFEDGCAMGFAGAVEEGALRKHLVRSGPLPAKARDLAAAPVDALPAIPIALAHITGAVAACLPDFHAAWAPDPLPVEIKSNPPYWLPTTYGTSFTRTAGTTRQRADLAWQVANAEVLEHARNDGVGEPTKWDFALSFSPPVTRDAGAE